jgi:DNA-binding MarR family transcriptional regulator
VTKLRRANRRISTTLATDSFAMVAGELTARDETAPGEDEPPLLSYIIGRLDRAIRNRLLEILEPLELSIPQFTTMSVLRRRPGLSNAQLARRALILPQSMIQVIAVLEARKLVERAPDPSHNRVLQTRLTAAGLALVEKAEDAIREIESKLLAAIGDDDAAKSAVDAMQIWLETLRTES